MIDAEGFRPNVGIIISNSQGQLLWARRIGGQDAWQFPQGGIRQGESPEAALYRELDEEVGLTAKDVKIIVSTRGWLRYCLPKHLMRHQTSPLCIGQKQKWFLLQLTSGEDQICLTPNDQKAEFDHWRWVSYWYPLNQVIAFKRDVYRRALKELSPAYCQFQQETLKQASSGTVSIC